MCYTLRSWKGKRNEKVPIGNKEMNVEISDVVPDGYNFLKEHDNYKIYEKCENDGDDVNHFYVTIIKCDV